MSASAHAQYFSSLATFLERDTQSDNPVRVQGALHRIREKLSPFRKQSDEEILTALRRTDFLTVVAREAGYDDWQALAKVGEGANPISGQLGAEAPNEHSGKSKRHYAYLYVHNGACRRLSAVSEEKLYEKVATQFCAENREDVLDRNRDEFDAALAAKDWRLAVEVFFEDSKHGLEIPQD